MSATLVGAVLKIGPDDQTRRFVMVAIADNADDYGFACPSEETIADMTVCSVRTVRRALQDLEEAAWIRIGRRMLNRGKSNVYFLNTEKLEVAPGPKSRKSPLHADLERMMGNKASANPKSMRAAAPVEDLKSAAVSKDEAAANLTALFELSPDTVSGEIVEDVELSPDKSNICHRTNSTLSPDKSCIPILKNRCEPLYNPNTITPQPPLRGGAVDFESRPGLSRNGSTGNKPFHEAAKAVSVADDAFELAVQAESMAAMQECGLSNPRLLRVFVDAMRMQHKRERMSPAESRMMMVASWLRWKSFCDRGLSRHTIGPRKFFGEGYWLDEKLWPVDTARMERESRRPDATIGMRAY